jgi:ketosteroid isomerase-like protein
MSDDDDLKQLEEAWVAAVEGNDLERADAILAEDFVLSSAGGVGPSVDREAWLARLPEITTRAYGISDVQARVFGDVAVVKFNARWEASIGERDLTGDYFLVDVFTRRGDAWQASWRISQRLSES